MADRYGIALFAWVILNNHYHLLVRPKNKEDVFRFIKALHGKSAIELNKLENLPGRKIWINYWDHSIRGEKDFWKHFNYIHHNPIKHNYVKKSEDYKFSSYHEWLKRKGPEWLNSCFALYPIADFSVEGDE